MAKVANKFDLPRRYREHTKEIVWYEYEKLAREYNPIDLGAGYPDFPSPKHITSALSEVAKQDNYLMHQYTRGCGHPRLVDVLSKLFSKFIGTKIDPFTEILITAGAYGALHCTINGHIDVGDEVIIIDPSFDSYVPVILAAGGIPKFVPLKYKQTSDVATAGDFVFDVDELKSAFNAKTKAIIINTPHNPTGKVFTKDELQEIANLCIKWDVLCISDEVYEFLVFAPNVHVRIASLPGMWERTITIGSAGKTFSITGWKIGWAYGSSNLIHNVQVVHQNSVYTCSTPSQEAIAVGFEIELERLGQNDSYFTTFLREMEQNKDYMGKLLSEAGMKPILPQGGYFMITDWSPLESQIDISKEKDSEKDYKFTKWLIKEVGVLGIPPTAFYSKKNKFLAENYVRFCFIKKREKLAEADKTFKKWQKAEPINRRNGK